MSFFQFMRDRVSEVSSGVSQQQNITTQVMDNIQGFVPKIMQSWIGGDANEFQADVARKIIPAITEVIAAIGGVNLNLTKATGVVDQADAKVKGMVDGLEQEFQKI